MQTPKQLDKLQTIPVQVPESVDRIIVARRLLAADDGHYPLCPEGIPKNIWDYLLGLERLERLSYAEAFLAEGIQALMKLEPLAAQLSVAAELQQGTVTDLNDFADKVRMMRDHQKAYFRTRSKQHLIESKKLEVQVDEMARRIRP